MPHRCAGCKTLFPDARHLRDGCPVCGCGKFVFENGRRRGEQKGTTTEVQESAQPDLSQEKTHDTKPASINQDPDSIESIRIIEPGWYDLNLSRLAESDDRVVRVGREDTYRLDLHSMIRQKKKK
jgi:predicted  nucleic acid-binding Zn-ribbon protein